jgi:hypothetical protein
MWKILVGFAVFAALALYILTKSGGNVDLGGEKHDVAPPAATAAPDTQPPAATASAALPAVAPAASK